MLPEIGLTNQFEKKFIEFFSFKPAIWHSGITKKNKEIIIEAIKQNRESYDFVDNSMKLDKDLLKLKK